MTTGQFPRTRKTAQQVYDDLVQAGRAASDAFGQFVKKSSKRLRAKKSVA